MARTSDGMKLDITEAQYLLIRDALVLLHALSGKGRRGDKARLLKKLMKAHKEQGKR